MRFEWDEDKNRENIRKHKLSFYDAIRVFADEKRIEKYDRENSTPEEERWDIIGMVNRVLFVVITERGDITRLISARAATKEEENEYYSDYDLR